MHWLNNCSIGKQCALSFALVCNNVLGSCETTAPDLYFGNRNAYGSLGSPRFPNFCLRHDCVVVSAYAAYTGLPQLLQLQGLVRLGHKQQHQQNQQLTKLKATECLRYPTKHDTLLTPNLVSESPCLF